MTQQAVAQIIPNIGNQEAAMAGNSAVIFTATDRELIEERSGKIDKNRSFVDLLKEKPLTAEVENEESSTKEHGDVKELKGRFREHRRMLKHSALFNPQEQVEIKNELSDKYEEPLQIPEAPRHPVKKAVVEEPKTKPKEEINAPEEIKSETVEAYDRITTEQKKLSSLGHRVKELHLKRLLSENENDFLKTSEEIKWATLRPVKSEAREWIEGKLDQLTLTTAKYKLVLLKSLQTIDHNDQRKKFISWVEKFVADASQT